MITIAPWILLCGAGWAFLVISERRRTQRLIVSALIAQGTASQSLPARTPPEKKRTLVLVWIFRVAGAVLFATARATLARQLDTTIGLWALLGGVAGELYSRGRENRNAEKIGRQLEADLPMVMEQVVMGVSSGLDIIPAVSEASRQGSDGVSKVFRRVVSLAEGGLPVEEAFRVVSDESDSAPLKHALIHLSLAYKQGGEVIRPLRELSDATQSHYQDRVEEEISKLPVKGILPLITIFAGLLICFLTIPLVQVGSITSKVTYGAR